MMNKTALIWLVIGVVTGLTLLSSVDAQTVRQLFARDGIVTNPGWSWGADTDTGVRRSASGTQIFVSNGSDVLTINSSGCSVANGCGDIDISGTPVNDQIAVWTDADTLEGDSDFLWDGANTLTIGVDGVSLTDNNDGSLTFLGLGNGEDEDFIMDLDGRANTVAFSSSTGVTDWTFAGSTGFGIGVTAPGQELEVVRDQNTSTIIKVINGTNGTSALSAFDMSSANSEGFFIVAPEGYTDVAQWADRVIFIAGSTGLGLLETDGLSFVAADSSADMKFYVGGFAAAEERVNILSTGIRVLTAEVTAASGTGVTVNEASLLQRVVYKVTVIQSHWSDASLTQDFTIAQLPAKTRITEIIADITEAFACTATCTSSTLSMVVGTGGGGSTFLDSFDVDAATAQFGIADVERGSALEGIINGNMPDWSGTENIVARLTSGTGNLGNGSVTNLSGGDITFYITTERMP